MLYTLEVWKQDRRYTSGKRLTGKYDYERRDRAAMDREIAELRCYSAADGYTFKVVETMVTRTNACTGATFQERYDVPFTCSPSSESYWSS